MRSLIGCLREPCSARVRNPFRERLIELGQTDITVPQLGDDRAENPASSGSFGSNGRWRRRSSVQRRPARWNRGRATCSGGPGPDESAGLRRGPVHPASSDAGGGYGNGFEVGYGSSGGAYDIGVGKSGAKTDHQRLATKQTGSWRWLAVAVVPKEQRMADETVVNVSATPENEPSKRPRVGRRTLWSSSGRKATASSTTATPTAAGGPSRKSRRQRRPVFSRHHFRPATTGGNASFRGRFDLGRHGSAGIGAPRGEECTARGDWGRYGDGAEGIGTARRVADAIEATDPSVCGDLHAGALVPRDTRQAMTDQRTVQDAVQAAVRLQEVGHRRSSAYGPKFRELGGFRQCAVLRSRTRQRPLSSADRFAPLRRTEDPRDRVGEPGGRHQQPKECTPDGQVNRPIPEMRPPRWMMWLLRPSWIHRDYSGPHRFRTIQLGWALESHFVLHSRSVDIGQRTLTMRDSSKHRCHTALWAASRGRRGREAAPVVNLPKRR